MRDFSLCVEVALSVNVPAVTLQDLTLLVSLHKNTQTAHALQGIEAAEVQSDYWSYNEGTGRQENIASVAKKKERGSQ